MNKVFTRLLLTGGNVSLGANASETDEEVIRASGLFDLGWYRARYPDVTDAGADPLAHFAAWGWREGRRANLYFDPGWYLRNYPDVARAGVNPLVHYIQVGEAENRSPCSYFDLSWFRARNTAPEGATLLQHFLDHRFSGAVTPIPEFDPTHYLSCNPDIAEAGVDPFEHFLLWGWKEGRNPSANFDTRFYVRRYLDPEHDENPLLHYRRLRHVVRLHISPPPEEAGVHDEVRRSTRPGPAFEEVAKLPRSAPLRATVLAYYLPQFHAIPENDTWWGRGFTEWTSTARGVPRFAGHYQPRIPRDLGHYALDNTEILRRQIALARGAGIGGFVWYFYWFNGRRLLEQPLEAMLADRTLDFPFCLMWANENWTRRWDGSDHEVLISQDWRGRDEPALIDTFARHFSDPRYIRIQGRPLLMIYRAGLIPDTAATLRRWRDAFRTRHGEDPVLVMSQSFDNHDPRPNGFDGAVEFPPHKLVHGLTLRDRDLVWFDHAASTQVYAYDEVVAASLAEPPPAFPLIKTAAPGWDNDARRQGNGLVLHGATPARYQEWLAGLIDRATAHPFLGERLVCVNAWNEWAEGAYLEPDLHYGGAWLNATARAVAPAASLAPRPLLLVGHDAFPAGAQHLLLHLGRTLRRHFGVAVEFLLFGGGRMQPDYAGIAPTTVMSDTGALAAHLATCAARGMSAAVVNSAASAWAIPALRAAGIGSVLLVHEMPNVLRDHGLLPGARAGAAAARRVVFPANTVRDAFVALAPIPPERTLLRPQGNYAHIAFSAVSRAELRTRFDVPATDRIVVGAGYADLRKGFDLFLQAWRAARRRDEAVRFWWIGDIDATLQAHLGAEIAAAEATGYFHMAGWQANIAAWLSAGDVFALPSREDPFPTVAIEALCTGLEVVAFAGGGGIPDLLREPGLGTAVPMGDAGALADAVLACEAAAEPERERRGSLAQDRFAFERYAFAVLREALPDLPAISVAVTNYNYARFLERRLASVFAQSHPVGEVILLDDASTDDSLALAARTAADWGRELRTVVNAANSGSPFCQWRKAAERAQGDWLWIAEADDEAEPGLLASLAAMVRDVPDLELAFCDSRCIGADGETIWPDYQAYYRNSDAGVLAQDGVFPARVFASRLLGERNLILNASAVLWRRTSLLAALDRCGDDLATYRLAGDWRIYLEALADSSGQVAFVAAPLNVHRRHGAGVTQSIKAASHIAEIARLHAVARQRLDLPADAARRQAAYRRRLARDLASG